jgi:hypothetical protein
MANGQVNEILKLYLYSQTSDSGVFLMEMLLNTKTGDMQITLKSDRTDDVELFVQHLIGTLSPILVG